MAEAIGIILIVGLVIVTLMNWPCDPDLRW
jgi:hypothetical protein